MHIYKYIKLSSTSIIILVTSLLHLVLIWPGILSPDSQGQYMMAISGIYGDHHPPLMSFVWRYLDRIYEGPGMIFLLHISLLYGAIFYLIKSIKSYSCRYIILLLALIPQIFLYSIMIWKDVGFTFCFLFVASYLAYLSSNQQQPSWHKTILLIIILLYGTAIKFQAQYCAPILLGWIAYIFANYQISTKKFIKTYLMVLISFYLLLNSINWLLIPNIQKNHAWQLVKIYDLAAISLETNTDLFPAFTKNKNFTMQEMFNRLNRHPLDRSKYYMVDDLIFGDAILKSGTNQQERRELYFAWVKAVIKYPLAYIKHRSINMTSMLLYHPAFKHISPFVINNNLLHLIVNSFIYLTFSNLIPAIVCFNAIGIMMILVLFFCSMAGTPRYTYITVCMAHASHVFAYLAYRSRSIGIPK